MNGKIVFLLASVVVLAFACGPRPHGADVATTTNPRATKRVTPARLAAALDVKIADDIAFEFSVTNTGGKKAEVNFPSGQTHDVTVLDSLGKVVWRSSTGRMFTQSLQNRVLRTADTLSYEEKWSGARRGRYVAVATLASANYPIEQRAEFVVR
jgi:hypothetical protein